jgi:hypothetical protein
MMQDRNGRDSDYLVPGTWYLAPVPHSHISNLNKALQKNLPSLEEVKRELGDDAKPNGKRSHGCAPSTVRTTCGYSDR